MEWFTRRHAVILARSSPSRLKYLEKTGIVVPYRTRSAQKPEVLYSWDQILEIRAIARLRQYLSFQTIRKIIRYFEDHGFDRSLRNKHLIVRNGSVTWVRPSANISPEMIQLHGKRDSQTGQLLLTTLEFSDQSPGNRHHSSPVKKVVNLHEFKQKLKPRS
jgi:DNA-binding transcriptional MerR regulator